MVRLTKVFMFVMILLHPALAKLVTVIFHNTNIYGKFDEVNIKGGFCNEVAKRKSQCVGGLSRTAAVLEKYRNVYKGTETKVLYFFTGSIFTGSIWFKLNTTDIAADFINLLKPTAITLGASEFHYGIDLLSSYLDGISSIPVVLTNIDVSLEPRLKSIKKSITLVFGKVKIGVVGYLSPRRLGTTTTGKVKFMDEIEAIRDECFKLQRTGADVIIALGHTSYERDREIAQAVPFVDIIIGGRGNKLFWNTKKCKPPEALPVGDTYPAVVDYVGIKKTSIIRVPGNTKYLGQLNVTFDDEGFILGYQGKPIFLANNMPKSQEAEKLLGKYRPSVESIGKEVLSHTHVKLLGRRKYCRNSECNLGNLMTDAMTDFVSLNIPTPFWTSAPIAIINGGAFVSDINPSYNKGRITRYDLYEAIPFDDHIVTISVTGNTLMQMYEFSVEMNVDGNFYSFLQHSGIHVLINMSKPVGSRIVKARARCGDCLVPRFESIIRNQTYNIVTTEYMVRGGDGFTMLTKKHFNYEKVHNDSSNILIWYLKRFSRIYPQQEGRVQFVVMNSSSIKSSVTCIYLFLIIYLLNNDFEYILEVHL